jgi:hypothetical protein
LTTKLVNWYMHHGGFIFHLQQRLTRNATIRTWQPW